MRDECKVRKGEGETLCMSLLLTKRFKGAISLNIPVRWTNCY